MRLQGHRKRRRAPEVDMKTQAPKLSWVEYKTLRQYQTMGDILEEVMAYGISGIIEMTVTEVEVNSSRNGHLWLTKELGPEYDTTGVE